MTPPCLCCHLACWHTSDSRNVTMAVGRPHALRTLATTELAGAWWVRSANNVRRQTSSAAVSPGAFCPRVSLLLSPSQSTLMSSLVC